MVAGRLLAFRSGWKPVTVSIIGDVVSLSPSTFSLPPAATLLWTLLPRWVAWEALLKWVAWVGLLKWVAWVGRPDGSRGRVSSSGSRGWVASSGSRGGRPDGELVDNGGVDAW